MEEKIPYLDKEKEQENLIKSGLDIMYKNPDLAQQFFKQSGLPIEEIQVRIADREFKIIDEKRRTEKEIKDIKESNRQILIKIYEERIENAEEKGDKEMAEFFKKGLEKI